MTTKPCPKKCGNTCDAAARCCIKCLCAERKVVRDEVLARKKALHESREAERKERLKHPELLIKEDQKKLEQEHRVKELEAKYDELRRTCEKQEEELKSLGVLESGIDTHKIEPKKRSGKSEATAVLVASDWHTEERVTPAAVNGLNTFNLDICDQRVTRFFQASLNLIKNHLATGVNITTVVLALIGDFITNELHDAESAESNQLTPVDALLRVQNQIASGIEFFLKNSPYSFVIPCKSGNHARTTKRTRFATESGHSLEYLMYVNLAGYFRQEKRVQFLIYEGYNHYLSVYDSRIRFHHGHAIKYQGGIGGIFIPAFKAISQWNKAKPVDLDVFGHFHQQKDGGNFISNGSLIGYNAFALSIKADYEVPKQTLFLVDRDRGRTCTWPVLL